MHAWILMKTTHSSYLLKTVNMHNKVNKYFCKTHAMLSHRVLLILQVKCFYNNIYLSTCFPQIIWRYLNINRILCYLSKKKKNINRILSKIDFGSGLCLTEEPNCSDRVFIFRPRTELIYWQKQTNPNHGGWGGLVIEFLGSLVQLCNKVNLEKKNYWPIYRNIQLLQIINTRR